MFSVVEYKVGGNSVRSRWCADGVADAAVLFGVAEADISVMHLPDEGSYPVGGDECVVPVHTIVLPDGGCLFHEPHPLKRMLF